MAVDDSLNVLVQRNCMVRLVQRMWWGGNYGGWYVGRWVVKWTVSHVVVRVAGWGLCLLAETVPVGPQGRVLGKMSVVAYPVLLVVLFVAVSMLAVEIVVVVGVVAVEM